MNHLNLNIVIVRTSTLILDLKTYNCQELGLARALSKKGYKMSFITPDRKASHTVENVEGGNPIDIYTVTFTALNRNICWHHGVEEILEEITPNLIQINSISLSMSLWYQKWAEKHGVKTVVIQGNYETTQKPILKQLETLYNSTLGRSLIKRTNGIGVKTNWAGKFVESYYPTETMLTRIGLDTERFSDAIEIDWRTKLGLGDKKLMLYVGIQEPRRNPLFLVDVLAELPDDYMLIMVGVGPQKSVVDSYISQRNLQKRILQLGKLPQEELPSLYKASDLFLLASSYEIFGMVILEAMYFGLPVISSLTAGSDAIIENNVDGVILNSIDKNIWASKIRSIADNSDLLQKMKAAARSKIINHLVWDKTADEFIALYKKAFNNGK